MSKMQAHRYSTGHILSQSHFDQCLDQKILFILLTAALHFVEIGMQSLLEGTNKNIVQVPFTLFLIILFDEQQ